MISTTQNSKKVIEYLSFVFGIILVCFLIQVLSWIKNDIVVFPSIIEVFSAFFKLLGDGNTYLYILYTLFALILAILISTILGLTLGVLAGVNKVVEQVLKPFMILFRSIPMIVLIVIIYLLVDNIIIPYITSILILTPIIYEAEKEGIKAIDRTYIDVYRLQSKFNLRVVFRVYLPMTSSYLKQAFSNMIGLGFKIIITVGYIAGVRNSFGLDLSMARQALEFDKLYAYALLFILIISIFELIPLFVSYIYNLVIFKQKKEEKIQKN